MSAPSPRPSESSPMHLALSLIFSALCLLSLPAQAKTTEPATIGFAAGWFDALENHPRDEAADFRVEYRSAYDMLDLAGGDNEWISIRPFGGFSTTTDSAHYAFAGFVFDVPIGDRFVFSPNIAVGLWDNGNGKYLGSFIEFRSTVEAGIRFDNGMRLTAAFGHISNAGLTKRNHGAEILSGYLHVPVNMIFGN
jgi:lipid A 3-O-deacylase